MSAHTPPPGFDARRFKALERSGFNRIAARYADGAHLRGSLQAALLDFRMRLPERYRGDNERLADIEEGAPR